MHTLIKYLCTMACVSAVPLVCSESEQDHNYHQKDPRSNSSSPLVRPEQTTFRFESRLALLPPPHVSRPARPTKYEYNDSLLLAEATVAKNRALEERDKALASLQEACATLQRASTQTDRARYHQDAAIKERDLAIDARERAEQTIVQLKDAAQVEKVQLSAALEKIKQLEFEKKTTEDTTSWAVESRNLATKTIQALENTLRIKKSEKIDLLQRIAQTEAQRNLARQERDRAKQTVETLENAARKKNVTLKSLSDERDTALQKIAQLESEKKAMEDTLETRALALSHQKRNERRKPGSSGSATKCLDQSQSSKPQNHP